MCVSTVTAWYVMGKILNLNTEEKLQLGRMELHDCGSRIVMTCHRQMANRNIIVWFSGWHDKISYHTTEQLFHSLEVTAICRILMFLFAI